MKLAVFAFSRRGRDTARRCLAALAGPEDEYRTYASESWVGEGFSPIRPPLADFTAPVFAWADAMVFVGACGITVRAIAPHVRDKGTDPAVLAVDELGQFVIPLLSGHIGGANRLAARLAEAVGATAVVTTATDVNRRFSVDEWSARQGLYIDDMAAAKAVSAAILEGPVPVWSDFPIAGDLPAGLEPGESGPLGICISWRRKFPFDRTLLLVPPVLRLGIGCRRGTSSGAIDALTDQLLAEHNVHPAAVGTVATIDLKKDETGLLDFCRDLGWPLSCYSAKELAAVEGDFTPSDFVRSVTGVDNVCERAALLGAERLLVKKTARGGVTAALALNAWEVRFG